MQKHKALPLSDCQARDIEISFFRDCKATLSNAISIDSLFALIRSGDGFKSHIERLRATNDSNERTELKQQLPAVTVSGLFDKARKKEHLTLYSGLMQIDLDKVVNIAEVRAKLEKDKYSFAVFLSPTGTGLKIIVKVVNHFSKHLQCFLALEKHFLEKYHLQVDKSCKDVTRLMFLSWDEDLFVNEKSIVFSPVNNFEEQEFEKLFNSLDKGQENTPERTQENKKGKKIENREEKKIEEKGDRKEERNKNLLFKLACLCSQAGISSNLTEKKCLEKFLHDDFSEKKIKSIIKRAFNNPMLKNEEENKIKEEKTIVFFSENDFEGKEFEKTINYLNKKEVFTGGNRNNYLFKLASLCSRRGISIDFTEKKCLEKFETIDFTRKEIKNAINSAFKNSSNSPKNKNGNKINSENGHSKIKLVENFLNSKYEFRNNIVSNKIEFKQTGTKEGFKELNENNVYCDLSRNNLEIPITKLMSLLNSDFVPVFNPFINYFENLKKWDSKTEIDFIEKLCSYIPVKDIERFKKHFKKMSVRCIACALQDSVFNKQAFIFVHDQQGSGKTSFCRWLCPPALCDYIAENINTDKDSQIALATNFLINMDELATLSKMEINALKSLISRDKINLRLPFDRRATVRPRRASFIGSTNKDEFLTDETGSVRWLCFELIAKINFDYQKDIDINDIWRQAFTLYTENFQYQLTQSEVEENEIVNKQYLVNTPEMDLIPKYFKPGTKEKQDEFLTATDIQNYIAMANPQIKLSPFAIGRALKVLGFTKGSHYNENTKLSIKGYYVSRQ